MIESRVVAPRSGILCISHVAVELQEIFVSDHSYAMDTPTNDHTGLKDLQDQWDRLGRTDPLWAVLTEPDKTGQRWDLAEFLETGAEHIRDTLDRLEELGFPARGGTALDFGCGVGRLSQALCAHFDRVVGVDIAPSMIAAAEKLNRFPGRCRYVLNSREDLNFLRNCSVDFVLSHIVLQHMRPKFCKNYLREFFRVLRAGGIAVFQIPSHREVPTGCSRISGPLPMEAFKVRIQGRNLPKELNAGATFDVFVTVQNCSSVVWPAFGRDDSEQNYILHLGNHWFDSSGAVVTVDDGRSTLPRDLASGDVADLSLQITAPSQPGQYTLELDMVQEGVAWFAHRGSSTWRTAVLVTQSIQRQSSGAKGELRGRMEMHGVPREEVLALTFDSGGDVLVVDSDPMPGWVSYRYHAKKK